ncbi:PREDICTED: mitogen-activated protein kinase kinase kinase NPK1-like [Nicotiana attenuata]|uniref:Mitogen-activated protein kinase kinase kinase npk1 n=1 Tax=Nicotiana attenuata TaxID=49451 RepID=A0A1J6JV11_NICAT|nr:PREDICTED: mitogen-activated protein kinase kinase kinase NPK1-like [Nicotiana attenuata]OIT20998.1 mitogen-activated protein kinase kinase kinase npk1 [Nicotiana attenuata]
MEWKKISVLGTGSYGKVYYAVKIDSFLLRASVAAVKCTDLWRSISLQREAHILETLRGSPNVVQFFGADVSIENNIPTYNLFLEYACGGSLHDLISSKRGKMSEVEIGFYAYQLLKGIQDVHKKGWVHCDIKPANVLVFDTNERGMHTLKLADFGLSLRIGDGMAYMTGTPLSNRGTLLYAPPESLTYGFHAKAYDIWSLGCTVAEMMTGNRVWIYRDTKDLQWQIMNEDPVIPSNVSEIARDFLYRCFINDPRRRWTSEQLLQLPFIQQAMCISNSMPKTHEGMIAKVNPFCCKIPTAVREKDFINLLFENNLRIQ